MAVKRQVNALSQMRLDIPVFRSLESAVSNDFDDLYRGLVIGENSTYLIRGFKINMTGAIGNNASSLQMIVENSAVLHGTDANSGTLLTVPTGTLAEVLNSGTNTKVSGSFVPGATNQVSLKFTRQTDATTTDLVAFWSPSTQLEFTKSVPLARVLDYQIVISSTGFDSDALPIALVVTDASNNVISVTNQHPNLFRLGKGGTLTPDPQFEFPWSEGRAENPVTSTSSTSPFEGGDRQLRTLKDWIDAIMSILKEIKGTPFWYSGGAGSWPGSIGSLRADTAHSVISGRGNIAHDGSTKGRITWSRDFFIRFLSGRLTYKIQANVNTNDIVLADNEVAYLSLVRDQDVSPNLIFTNGSAVVQSVGSVAWTNVIGLQVGDYVKVASEFDDKYFEVLTVDSNSQVTLTENYTETSTGAAGAKSRYAFGVYGTNTGTAARDIVVADRSVVVLAENTYWLFFRDDNGSNKAKVFARFLGSELEEGETRFVSDNTTSQLLSYMGATSEMDDTPSYSEAVDQFEITQIEAVPPADITVGQAFNIFSANDATQYYGWFSDAAAPGVGDPSLPGTGVEIQVDFSTPDTEVQVAVKIAAAFNALGDFASSVPTTNVLTIVNAAEGNSTDATNVDIGGAFKIISLTQGATGTLNAQQNYNSVEGENLTARASRLTSMMADKAQDKEIGFGPDFNTIINTTNAANQDITFTGGGLELNVNMSGSPANGTVGLGGTLSLAVNQTAYYSLDRNAGFTIADLTSLTVVDTDSVPIGENITPFAWREAGTDVFLWDSTLIEAGATVPSAAYLQLIIQQNKTAQLVEDAGNAWDWNLGTTTLSWSTDLFIQIAGITKVSNEINVGSTTLTSDGQVAYVSINRVSGASVLSISTADIASVSNNDDIFIFARRIGSKVLVDSKSHLLIDGGKWEIQENLNVTGDVVVTGDFQVDGTTTTLNTQTLDVEDSNITVNKNGNQSAANTNDAGITVEMSDATDARLHYDSSVTSKWKIGEVGSEEELVTTAHSQQLDNKTLNAGIVTGDTQINDTYREETTNDGTATGSNATIAALPSPIIRLTNGSLISLGALAVTAAGRNVTIINATGNTIQVENDNGATAAEGIFTGTGADVNLLDDASLILKYDNTDSRWRVIGGTGSGAGGGVLNFHTLGDAEDHSDTSKFSTGNNITFDGGGSLAGTFSISTTAADLIRDTKVFKLVGDATAGNNTNDYIAADPENIPQGYRGRWLVGKIQYKWDGSDDLIKWVVKDTTNTAILTTEQETIKTSAGANDIAKEFNFVFFCPSDCEQVEIGPQVITGESSKILIWDDSIITPNLVTDKELGIITDWESFTPTGSWTTNVTYTGFKKRIGDTAHYKIKITLSGATDSSTLEINVADGTIDTGKLTAQTSGQGRLGDATILDSGTQEYMAIIAYQSTSNVEVAYFNDSAALEAVTPVSDVAPFTFASGDTVEVNFSVPIVGWDAQTEHIVSATNNVPLVKYETNAGQSINSASTDVIDFEDIVFDDDSLVTTGASWNYAAASIGIHKVSAKMLWADTAWAAGDITTLKVFVGGVEVATLAEKEIEAAGTYKISLNGSVLVNVTKGQTIDVRADQNTGGALTLDTTASKNYINIEKKDVVPVLAAFPFPQVAYIKDVKAANTDGGTFTLGAWRIRDLNTLTGDISFISVSSNQIILQPGKYRIYASASAYKVDEHKCKLRNITDSTDDIIGSSEISASGDGTQSISVLEDTITISEGKTFEIQHQSTATQTIDGFGVASNFSVDEVYTQVRVEKIA